MKKAFHLKKATYNIGFNVNIFLPQMKRATYYGKPHIVLCSKIVEQVPEKVKTN